MSETKSMADVAFDLMNAKKRAINFSKLWQEVVKETKVSNDKVAQFYSDLTLDGRFVLLKDNKWDLKNRRKFAESQINVEVLESDDDEQEIFDEDGNVINDIDKD